MSDKDIIKIVVHTGTKTINFIPGTKVIFHFKTSKCDFDKTLIDDSRTMGNPMELVLGKKFKLEVWEAIVQKMALNEVACFEVHKTLEKLLINQLDGTIEIPEVLHFACNDHSQLLDQLKVLQMVLRKEREKNQDNSLPINSLSSEIQSLSTATSDIKKDLKEKVERHKNAMIQKRQDKQIDAEAQALSKALINKECESSEGTKAKKRSQESFSAAVVNKEDETDEHREQQSCCKDSQQNISDSQSSSTSNEQNASSKTGTSIMDMYQACDSEKTRKLEKELSR